MQEETQAQATTNEETTELKKLTPEQLKRFNALKDGIVELAKEADVPLVLAMVSEQDDEGIHINSVVAGNTRQLHMILSTLKKEVEKDLPSPLACALMEILRS